MRKHVLSRGLFTLALAFASVLSFVLAGPSAYAATSAYNSHPVYVHPSYLESGKPDATGAFPCQNPTSIYRCYGPKQIRAAYAIQPLLERGINGSGSTIVIIDAFQSPTIVQDLQTFNQTFRLRSAPFNIIAPDGLTPFNPKDANQVGWAEEISLDVEWSHAVAPAATIDLVLAKSNQDADLLSVTKYVVDNRLGDVISQSFGEAESCADPALLKVEHAVFQEAANKRITVLASSGDQGAAQPTCDNTSYFLSASTPASDPLVTATGGTQLDANAKTGKYIQEIAWNERDLPAASGGGYSTIYSRPAYQVGTVHSNQRGLPDVAYDAAVNGGVLVAVSVIPSGSQGGPFHIFGGTSSSSPQWAGIVALADQVAGESLGFLNPTIYRIGRSSSYTSAFHDIIFGNNTFVFMDAQGNTKVVQGYNTNKGWDAVTGWGSPIVARLVGLLN
ncbi:MAG: S53 family peptidase [Ktedonobacteraceae bacterium]